MNSDNSNNKSYRNRTDTNEFSDVSESDTEYTSKKECRKKLKLEEKLNSKNTKNQKSKQVDLCRDIQLNDIRRVSSPQSTNCAAPNLIETKGILLIYE